MTEKNRDDVLSPVVSGIALVFTLLVDELETRKLIDRRSFAKKLQITHEVAERQHMTEGIDPLVWDVFAIFAAQLADPERQPPFKPIVIPGGRTAKPPTAT